MSKVNHVLALLVETVLELANNKKSEHADALATLTSESPIMSEKRYEKLLEKLNNEPAAKEKKATKKVVKKEKKLDKKLDKHEKKAFKKEMSTVKKTLKKADKVIKKDKLAKAKVKTTAGTNKTNKKAK